MNASHKIHLNAEEQQMIDLVRETVAHLNALGDRLERYAEAKVAANKGKTDA